MFIFSSLESETTDGDLKAKNVLTTMKPNNDNMQSLTMMYSCFKWTISNKENNSKVDRFRISPSVIHSSALTTWELCVFYDG